MNPVELAILAIIAPIIFGPKSLPQVACELRLLLEELHRYRGGGPEGPTAA